MLRTILYKLTHNIFINNLAILLRIENRLKSSNAMWRNYKVDTSKTLQEIVGFSHRPDVEEALAKAHSDLISIADTHLKTGGRVLDIGCGTGLYLKDLHGKGYGLSGIDMSAEMIIVATKELPDVTFYIGDFMNFRFPARFDLIYSVSVLEYIARNDLDAHFERLAANLNSGGIIFIHYPHALRRMDTLYPDLNYIKYSPSVVERTARHYFKILKHEHCFDGRVIKNYDHQPYPSVSGTFKNGYLLIAQKK